MYEEVFDVIRTLYPHRNSIPLHEPLFFGNENAYLAEVINSKCVSTVGDFTRQFETKIAQFTGAKHAIACNTGTSALHLSLICNDVQNGDLVITQPVSYVASTNAILYCGAEPLFVDVDDDTLGLSPKALQTFINEECVFQNNSLIHQKSNKKIKACLPVYTLGHSPRIDEIAQICTKYNLALVEDAAEAIGTYYKGQHAGTFGNCGILSFNGNKIVTTGGGGMLLTNDSKIAELALHISTQSKIRNNQVLADHDQMGFNYRMPNLNAALGIAQFLHLKDFLERKKIIFKEYNKKLISNNFEIYVPISDSNSNFWTNALRFSDVKERDTFVIEAQKQNIECRGIWKNLQHQKFLKDYHHGSLINSLKIEKSLALIPSF